MLFFLPPYSAYLNPIEGQWHQLKAHEIAGRMFEDEYDLAKAVIQGIEVRSQFWGYALERFKFNSAELLTFWGLLHDHCKHHQELRLRSPQNEDAILFPRLNDCSR